MGHKKWFLVAAVGLGLALTGLLTTALASSAGKGATERIPAAPQIAPLTPGITESPWGAVAYEGVPGNAVSGQCYFPFVDLETNGPSTTLVIQNATASSVPYTVTLYDVVAGAAGTVTGTLPARGSVRYQPDDLVSFLSQTLPFYGAAVAYADGAIACSAQVEDGAQALDEGDGWFAYTAPYTSAAELVLPFVRRGYEGWNSLLFIQHTGEAIGSLGVDIQFYDADGEQVMTVTESLAPYTRWVIDVTNVGLPAGFNGWARVMNSSNADTLAAVVLAEQPSGTRGVVALTAWDVDELASGGDVVLPRAGRAPSPDYWSTEYTLYNLWGYQQIDRVVEYRMALDGSLSVSETVTLPEHANVVQSLDTVNLPEQTWDGAVRAAPATLAGPTGIAVLAVCRRESAFPGGPNGDKMACIPAPGSS